MTSEQKKLEILNYIFKSKDGASWNEVAEMLNEYKTTLCKEQRELCANEVRELRLAILNAPEP